MIDTSKFWVIAVISNPVRFNSRWELFKKFEKHVLSLTPNLIVVEQSFGCRNFQITSPSNPNHLQVRSLDELWHKENMVNIGVQHLSKIAPDWQYMAWIDADIEFNRKDIIEETVHQLQHYEIVQMFQHAIDLGPDGETFQVHNGFMYSYLNGKPQGKGYTHWHSGYAWAINRDAYDKIGGLYDVSILGSGDNLMAHAFIGKGLEQLPMTMSCDYRKSLQDWEERVTRLLYRDVGYVKGTIMHQWHGKKKDRKYKDRWKILEDSQFSPFTDIKRDAYGLWQLDVDNSERMIKFRDDLRQYFRARKEDSSDIE